MDRRKTCGFRESGIMLALLSLISMECCTRCLIRSTKCNIAYSSSSLYYQVGLTSIKWFYYSISTSSVLIFSALDPRPNGGSCLCFGNKQNKRHHSGVTAAETTKRLFSLFISIFFPSPTYHTQPLRMTSRYCAVHRCVVSRGGRRDHIILIPEMSFNMPISYIQRTSYNIYLWSSS